MTLIPKGLGSQYLSPTHPLSFPGAEGEPQDHIIINPQRETLYTLFKTTRAAFGIGIFQLAATDYPNDMKE